MNDAIISFTSPPVVEVVVGVAFDGLNAETGALLAAFWKERLRHEFPVLQQQPPYSPPDEQFPLGTRPASFNFNIGPAFPTARLWAQSSDGQELIQLQPGWFAYNWRLINPQRDYDRWKNRRAEFRKHLEALSDYLVREGLGQPKLRQCEVTYINHITPSNVWANHSDFRNVFRFGPPVDLPNQVEQISVQSQLIIECDDQPCGRLYAKVLPAFGPDGTSPLYVLELTARGAPQGDDIDGALRFLDRGRRVANHTFVALTTEAMHQEWGLQV